MLKSLFRTPTLFPPPKKKKKICNSDNSLHWLPYIFIFRAENCFMSISIPHYLPSLTLTSSPFCLKMFLNMYIAEKFLKWHNYHLMFFVTCSCILLINIVDRVKEITCASCSSQSVILYNYQWNKSRFLTFVTTLKVVFFSSVSEQVTVTRSMSVPGVVGLKWTNQIVDDRS